MTTMDPNSEARSAHDALSWLQNEMVQSKSHLAKLYQQGDQVQAAIADLNEKLRDMEGRLREFGAKVVGLPQMAEQVRQLAGLLDRIQDTEVLIDTKFEMLERTLGEERTRDQAEKNDLYRRTQDLERRAELLHERQSALDENVRRVQEEIGRTHVQGQSVGQRLDALETKAARSLDAITRIEQTHGDIEAAIRALRREDDVLAERARLAHEIAARLEAELHQESEELRVLPLLQERVELLRAERQRLEDRTSRAEEQIADLQTRVEREEDVTAHVDVRLRAQESRVDHVHASTLDYRRMLNEQLLKMNQLLERMRRREAEELERQAKELRTFANQLKVDDE